jgi:hypothetical protein
MRDDASFHLYGRIEIDCSIEIEQIDIGRKSQASNHGDSISLNEAQESDGGPATDDG